MSKREVRRARQAALEAERERQRRIRIGVIAGVGVLVVAGIVWLVVAQLQRPVAVEAAPADVIANEYEVPYEGAAHIPVGQKATYSHYPPASGPHWNQPPLGPVTWGVYQEVVAPESWVHNLEHGGIVVLYNCPDGCPDTQAALERFAARVPNSRWGTQKIVLAPDPQIPAQIAALAWNRELDLSGFDEARLLEFYKRWVDTGPEQTP